MCMVEKCVGSVVCRMEYFRRHTVERYGKCRATAILRLDRLLLLSCFSHRHRSISVSASMHFHVSRLTRHTSINYYFHLCSSPVYHSDLLDFFLLLAYEVDCVCTVHATPIHYVCTFCLHLFCCSTFACIPVRLPVSTKQARLWRHADCRSMPCVKRARVCVRMCQCPFWQRLQGYSYVNRMMLTGSAISLSFYGLLSACV